MKTSRTRLPSQLSQVDKQTISATDPRTPKSSISNRALVELIELVDEGGHGLLLACLARRGAMRKGELAEVGLQAKGTVDPAVTEGQADPAQRLETITQELVSLGGILAQLCSPPKYESSTEGQAV